MFPIGRIISQFRGQGGGEFDANKDIYYDVVCYALAANVIFPISYHSDIPHIEKKIYCGKG
jgi:hypothetical protein